MYFNDGLIYEDDSIKIGRIMRLPSIEEVPKERRDGLISDAIKRIMLPSNIKRLKKLVIEGNGVVGFCNIVATADIINGNNKLFLNDPTFLQNCASSISDLPFMYEHGGQRLGIIMDGYTTIYDKTSYINSLGAIALAGKKTNEQLLTIKSFVQSQKMYVSAHWWAPKQSEYGTYCHKCATNTPRLWMLKNSVTQKPETHAVCGICFQVDENLPVDADRITTKKTFDRLYNNPTDSPVIMLMTDDRAAEISLTTQPADGFNSPIFGWFYAIRNNPDSVDVFDKELKSLELSPFADSQGGVNFDVINIPEVELITIADLRKDVIEQTDNTIVEKNNKEENYMEDLKLSPAQIEQIKKVLQSTDTSGSSPWEAKYQALKKGVATLHASIAHAMPTLFPLNISLADSETKIEKDPEVLVAELNTVFKDTATIETKSVAEATAENTQKEEAKRVEAERVEAERVEAEAKEAERIEAERIEAERIEAERVQKELEDKKAAGDIHSGGDSDHKTAPVKIFFPSK